MESQHFVITSLIYLTFASGRFMLTGEATVSASSHNGVTYIGSGVTGFSVGSIGFDGRAISGSWTSMRNM